MRFTKDTSPLELPQTRVDTKSPTTPKKSVGDMYFIKGSPYIDCLICEQPVRYVDALQYKVSKLLGFKKITSGRWIKGVWTLEDKYAPKMLSGFGCFNCWNHQQRNK